MNPAKQPKQLGKQLPTWMGIGVALGVAFGAAFDQVGLGIALGAAFGVAIGFAGDAMKSDRPVLMAADVRLTNPTRSDGDAAFGRPFSYLTRRVLVR